MSAQAEVDLSEIDAFDRGTGSPTCATAQIVAGKPWRGQTLCEGDREKLTAALATERFSDSTLSSWLKSKGIDLGASSLGRHRNGGCRCARA